MFPWLRTALRCSNLCASSLRSYSRVSLLQRAFREAWLRPLSVLSSRAAACQASNRLASYTKEECQLGRGSAATMLAQWEAWLRLLSIWS